MNFEEVNNLKIDNSTGLYDITQSVYIHKDSIPFYPHIVEKHEEMRMDLISDRLYDTTEHTAFLCRLNNIINPLNIKEDTLLIYTDESFIKEFEPQDEGVVEGVKQAFINLNKKRRIDANREEYNKNKDSDVTLSPVFNEKDVKDVVLGDDGVITINPSSLQ